MNLSQRNQVSILLFPSPTRRRRASSRSGRCGTRPSQKCGVDQGPRKKKGLPRRACRRVLRQSKQEGKLTISRILAVVCKAGRQSDVSGRRETLNRGGWALEKQTVEKSGGGEIVDFWGEKPKAKRVHRCCRVEIRHRQLKRQVWLLGGPCVVCCLHYSRFGWMRRG